MNIAICDDSTEYTNIMETYLESMKIPGLDIDVFYSGEELVKSYENNGAVFDAVFLDMEMGELDGIETANRIRQIDKHVIIVFVTSHTKYMLRSFECSPFRFLVKPVEFDEVEKVMTDVLKKLSEERTTFVFTENRNKIRLFCDDIIYFECQAHYIKICTKDNSHKILRTMTELMESIDKNMFLQVHKSFIVNLNLIREIRESEIVMYNTEQIIPISRSYKKQVAEAFINFKERKYLI